MSTTITTSNDVLRARSEQETLTTTQDIPVNKAGTEFNIATDAIHGTVGSVSSGGVDNKDWINTKATANKGDWCSLKAVALTDWYLTGGDGVWASES